MGLEEYRRWFIARGIGPEYACRTYRLPVAPDELRALKAPVCRALLEEGVRAMPGAREALARLATSHRLALATNTARAEVDLILEQLGLASFLCTTITREDYVRAKPAPDAYLAAAAALGLAAVECAVVEDTERGAAAALAAGIPVIAVPNDLTFDNDFTGCACRLAPFGRLLPGVRPLLPRPRGTGVPRLRGPLEAHRAAGARGGGRACARRLRARSRGAAAHRHALEGLPPARRPGAGPPR